MAVSYTHLNQTMRDHDYELVTGRWPQNYNELVLITTHNYEISDYTLYALGLLDITELQDALAEAQKDIMENGSTTQPVSIDHETKRYSYEDLMALDLHLVLPTDYFVERDDGLSLIHISPPGRIHRHRACPDARRGGSGWW